MLTAESMTGYDLVKYFDGSVAFVWQAPHSQIYPELRRMEAAGLLEAEVVARGERAEKRIYSISSAGLAELRSWATTPLTYPPERSAHRLRAAFLEWSTYEAARNQLLEHRNHFTRALRTWEHMIEDIEAVRVPLLRRRLERNAEEQAEAIVAFKAFAFRAELARAKLEIEWAKEGLALLDHLEAAGVPLAGEAAAVPTDAP